MKKKSSRKAAPALRRISLQFQFPTAASVSVSGSFNHWDAVGVPLVALGGGAWAIELVLPPGRHEYRLLVDGEWTDVPGGAEAVDNPFGTRNAVVVVGPAT